MKKFILFAIIATALCACKDEPVVTSITLDKTELALNMTEFYIIQVSHHPAEAQKPTYTFESDNEDVIRIDSYGKITPIGVGTASIRAKATEISLISAPCKVTVTHLYPTQIKLNTDFLELEAGKTSKLSFSTIPNEATFRDVVWETDNSKVANIDQSGNLTAVSEGKANISVKIVNSDISDVCAVTVKPASVTGIKIFDIFNNELQSTDILVTCLSEIFVKVLPENAGNKDVVFESTNPEIAYIEKADDKYYIIAKNLGTATIAVKTVDGNHKASCLVNVRDIFFDTSLNFVVGTEGNTVTGFYSYVYVQFCPNIAGRPIEVKELKITDNTGNIAFVYHGYTLQTGYMCYVTPKIITTQGLQTYPATGWKVDVAFAWNGKEYNISQINQ